MPDSPTDQPKPRRRGDGFPGRTAWNQAHDRFRQTVARLARDQDAEAAAAAIRIVEHATQMLTALTAEAVKAQQKAVREREALELEKARLRRQVNRLGRTGRPLGPSLAAYADPPREPS
ncbi:hypothetical protein [Streptomyces sp. HGB0020]|uniref:hypothetical protein n=1 Tax=Streptomyces sp. HGB0020 TaxID=1078086 RepID=UPI00034E86D1|nr:hypothetical protein [Streptomyces sp. HGB0020]EPD62390.1 hypothetical protein HMPREF1211_04024 [Streptomyces sp. HGB0020]